MAQPISTGRPATLADIARATDLSIPTVSRALRDHPDVSLETRERVKQEAAKLAYRGSPVARALRTGRYNALSFVVPYGIIGWWEPLLKGAGREAAKLGYQLVLNPVSAHFDDDETSDESSAESIVDFFRRSSNLPVDGFVVVTPDSDAWKSLESAQANPIVIIDDVRDHPGFHVWSSDNYQGARSAVEYLIDKGRQRIAALVPRRGLYGLTIENRLAGYRDAVRAAGLPEIVMNSEETYPPTLNTSDAVDTALADGVEFDGIFALADFAAFGVLRSLRQAGLSVPDRVSVVGFDDDIAAMALDPSLTTMAQPLADIGAAAVRTVVGMVAGDDAAPIAHRMETTLVERNSS